MSDRLLFALALLATVALLGALIRALAARRRAAIVAREWLTPAAAAPRVLAFSGPGCAACRVQQRILDDLRVAWCGGLQVDHVDATAEVELARRFGVLIVPTTVVAAPDGRVVAINGGVADVDRLLAQLAEAA